LSIGITHAELDDLTLVELNERIVGHNERQNETWQRHAQLTAYILTALAHKRIKARDLMPEVFDALPIYTPEEKQKELDDIKKEVGLN